MADLYNSDLGGNTRKVTPSSMFGTREIKWLHLDFDYNVYTDNGPAPDGYKNSDSLYWAAVKCIQEVAEIVYLGAPTRIQVNSFVIGIASDTAQWYYSDEGYNDANEIGVDETDDAYPNRYFPGSDNWPNGPFNGVGNLLSSVNDIADRLAGTFGSPFWWSLVELEDCGFGLMRGNPIADPGAL